MTKRIAVLAVALATIGGGFGAHTARADGRLLKGDGDWVCVWVDAADLGHCQGNPLPPELPIPPG